MDRDYTTEGAEDWMNDLTTDDEMRRAEVPKDPYGSLLGVKMYERLVVSVIPRCTMYYRVDDCKISAHTVYCRSHSSSTQLLLACTGY